MNLTELQREWTAEIVSDMAFPSRDADDGPWQRIADAHNAALFEARKGGVADTLTACEGQVMDLKAQLAAARKLQQLTEDNQVRWMRNCEKLERQLAEETEIVNKVWSALGITNYEQAKSKTIWELVSELKAIAEATKPLVEKITELEGRLSKYEQS